MIITSKSDSSGVSPDPSSSSRTSKAKNNNVNNHNYGGGSGTTPLACASCKYQRRKCSPDCPLAKFFPAESHHEFVNAHKLFGVSNILKILKSIPKKELWDAAMETIKYQANARENYPVHGCLGIYRSMEQELEILQNELQATLAHIDILKQQFARQVCDNGGPPAFGVEIGRMQLDNINGNGVSYYYGGYLGGNNWASLQAEMGNSPATGEMMVYDDRILRTRQMPSSASENHESVVFRRNIDEILADHSVDRSETAAIKEEQQDEELKQAAQLFSLRNSIHDHEKDQRQQSL